MESKRVDRAEKLSPGISGRLVKAPLHAWRKGTATARIQEMPKFYQKRYGEP